MADSGTLPTPLTREQALSDLALDHAYGPDDVEGTDDPVASPDLQREENVATTEEGTEERTDAPRLFGGLTAQEAGRRSAQRARERAETEQQEAEAETAERTAGPHRFDQSSAREAGLKSAQLRRARALAGETEEAQDRAHETRTVRVTVEVGRVLDKLSKQAKDGNVQAARELRSYLRDLPTEKDTDMSSLDRRTRQQVLARVLSEIDAAEGH